jgi:hypothetical protein
MRVSWRVFRCRNVRVDGECRNVVGRTVPFMKRSTVAHPSSSKLVNQSSPTPVYPQLHNITRCHRISFPSKNLYHVLSLRSVPHEKSLQTHHHLHHHAPHKTLPPPPHSDQPRPVLRHQALGRHTPSPSPSTTLFLLVSHQPLTNPPNSYPEVQSSPAKTHPSCHTRLTTRCARTLHFSAKRQ